MSVDNENKLNLIKLKYSSSEVYVKALTIMGESKRIKKIKDYIKMKKKDIEENRYEYYTISHNTTRTNKIRVNRSKSVGAFKSRSPSFSSYYFSKMKI